MILVEYCCPHHGRFEWLEPHEAHDSRACEICGTDAPWVMSAPSIKPSVASVESGRSSSERPKDYLSTSAIADGMTRSEWQAEQNKRRKERIREHVRSKLG